MATMTSQLEPYQFVAKLAKLGMQIPDNSSQTKQSKLVPFFPTQRFCFSASFCCAILQSVPAKVVRFVAAA